MTRDDIIKLAGDAGIEFQSHAGVLGRVSITTTGSQSIDKVARLVELAMAAEREECAKVCEEKAEKHADFVAGLCAAAIRARSKP